MKVSKEFFTLPMWILSLIFDLGLCSPSFMKSVLIQNLFCSSAANIDFGQLRSSLQCAQKCYNDVDCQSFFYKLSGICLGSTVIVSNPLGCSSESGTIYYVTTAPATTTTTTMTTTPGFTTVPGFPTVPTATTIPMNQPCSVDTDCFRANTYCLNFWCECKPGYSLNPSTLSCTNGCAVYGTTYLLYWYKVLDDGLLYNNVSQLQCKGICKFTSCRSFSYNFRFSSCKISNETAVTMPTAFGSNPQMDYYNRNCA